MKDVNSNKKLYARIILLALFGTMNAILFQNCSNWKGNVLVDTNQNKLIDANGDVIDTPLNDVSTDPVSVGDVIVVENSSSSGSSTSSDSSAAVPSSSSTSSSSTEPVVTDSSNSSSAVVPESESTASSSESSGTATSVSSLSSESSPVVVAPVDCAVTPNDPSCPPVVLAPPPPPAPAIAIIEENVVDTKPAENILNSIGENNAENAAAKLCGANMEALKALAMVKVEDDAGSANDELTDEQIALLESKQTDKFENLIKNSKEVWKVKKKGLKLNAKGVVVVINDEKDVMEINEVKVNGLLILCGNIKIEKLKSEAKNTRVVSIDSSVSEGHGRIVSTFSKSVSQGKINFTKVDSLNSSNKMKKYKIEKNDIIELIKGKSGHGSNEEHDNENEHSDNHNNSRKSNH